MKNIQSRDELEKLIKTKKHLIIDFTAKWCGPCQQLKPLLGWFEDDDSYRDLTIVSVDIDRFIKLADEYHVQSIPTLVFMSNGVEVNRFVGVKNLEELRTAVRKLLGMKLKWLSPVTLES